MIPKYARKVPVIISAYVLKLKISDIYAWKIECKLVIPNIYRSHHLVQIK